jgi:hypothetical protein
VTTPAEEFDRRLAEAAGGDSAETVVDTAAVTGDTLEEPADTPDSDTAVDTGESATYEGIDRATYRLHDWEAVRRAYVEGWPAKSQSGTQKVTFWPTLREVAERFGISDPYVREKSSKQGWTEQRRTWQAQLEAQHRQARAATMSKKATEVDSTALDAATMGLQLCLAALADIGQRAQQRRSETMGQPDIAPRIDALEQSRLAQAVDLWHKVGLRAVGDPETHRLEITGAGGGPIELAAELRRDDPDRIAGVLAVLAAADLGDVIPGHVLDSYEAGGDGRGDGVQEAAEAHR